MTVNRGSESDFHPSQRVKIRACARCSTKRATRRPSRSTAASTNTTSRTWWRRRRLDRRGLIRVRVGRRRGGHAAAEALPRCGAGTAGRSPGRGERHESAAPCGSVRETDQMGSHTTPTTWLFEVGRCEWLRSLGCVPRTREQDAIMLPVIERIASTAGPPLRDEIFIRTGRTGLPCGFGSRMRWSVRRRAVLAGGTRCTPRRTWPGAEATARRVVRSSVARPRRRNSQGGGSRYTMECWLIVGPAREPGSGAGARPPALMSLGCEAAA